MPKFTETLTSLDQESNLEVGKNFANFHLLSIFGAHLPKGFFITNEGFQTVLEQIKPLVLSISKSIPEELNKGYYYQDVISLLQKNVNLPAALTREISQNSKPLHFPLSIRANSTVGQKSEVESFETTIFSADELLPNLKFALLSFLSPTLVEEISYDAFSKISQAIIILEKPRAEISGRVVVTTGASAKIRLYSQWGEFHPSWTSDHATYSLNSGAEEEYNNSLQENQIILHGQKYTSQVVPQKFQFARKLDDTYADTICTLAKKLASKLLVGFELHFSISEDRLLITKLITEQSAQGEEITGSLIDYMKLQQHLKPLIHGIKIGPLRRITTNKDFSKIRYGDIVQIKTLEKKFLPKLKKSGGLIIDNSLKLTAEQLATLRNSGKTALQGSLETLRHRVVTIDGSSGKVYLGSFRPPYTKVLTVSDKLTSVDIATKHVTNLLIEINTITEAENSHDEQINGYVVRENTHFEKIAKILFTEQKLTLVKTENQSFLKTVKLVRKLRNQSGFTTLALLLPEITTVTQFRELKKTVSAEHLYRGGTFKLFVEITNPASALTISEIISEGIDGVIINYRSLINSLYGKDFSLDELGIHEDKSVEVLLNQILNSARSSRIYVAVSNLPKTKSKTTMEKLISKGLSAIVIPTSEINHYSKLVAQAEKEFLTTSR